jgi:hypothetical protein
MLSLNDTMHSCMGADAGAPAHGGTPNIDTRVKLPLKVGTHVLVVLPDAACAVSCSVARATQLAVHCQADVQAQYNHT